MYSTRGGGRSEAVVVWYDSQVEVWFSGLKHQLIWCRRYSKKVNKLERK